MTQTNTISFCFRLLLAAILLTGPTAVRAQFGGGLGSGATVSEFSASSALPLTLLSFDAAAANRDVQVTWVTMNELNTDYFLVERTVDGSHFSTVGRVEAAGTSAPDAERRYALADPAPDFGSAHYRLKSVDTDGTFTYSRLVHIAFHDAGNALSFTISPNPSTGNVIGLDLHRAADDRELSVDVMDPAGRFLTSLRLTGRSGERLELRLPEHLPVGTYLLRLSQHGSGSRTERLVVAHSR